MTISNGVGLQVLYDPRVLLPYSHLGETDELCVQDISSFAGLGERLCFWQLQVCADRLHPSEFDLHMAPQYKPAGSWRKFLIIPTAFAALSKEGSASGKVSLSEKHSVRFIVTINGC